jgi:hypothetical protein
VQVLGSAGKHCIWPRPSESPLMVISGYNAAEQVPGTGTEAVWQPLCARIIPSRCFAKESGAVRAGSGSRMLLRHCGTGALAGPARRLFGVADRRDSDTLGDNVHWIRLTSRTARMRPVVASQRRLSTAAGRPESPLKSTRRHRIERESEREKEREERREGEKESAHDSEAHLRDAVQTSAAGAPSEGAAKERAQPPAPPEHAASPFD